MKKILAIVLACVLALAVFAGCTTPAVTPTEKPADNPTAAPAPSDFEPKEISIAFGFPNVGMPMLEIVSKTMEEIAAKANCKIVYAGSMGIASDPDACISFVEQSIAAQVDGLVIMPPADSVLPTICQKCEEAGVYWTISLRNINDESVKAMCEASEYFCGNVHEDEYEVGRIAGQLAKESGYKKIGLISTTVGNTSGDLREQGFIDAFGEGFAAEARGHTQASDLGNDVASMLTAHQDIDMIFQAASFAVGGADAGIAKVKESGLNVKYNCVDGPSDPKEAYGSGIMEWYITGTGHYSTFSDPMIAFIKTLNACQGFKLTDEGKTCSYTKLSPAVHKTLEEALAMQPMYMDPEFIYFSDEMVDSLLAWKNPELTAAKFQEIIDGYDPLTMSPYFNK